MAGSSPADLLELGGAATFKAIEGGLAGRSKSLRPSRGAPRVSVLRLGGSLREDAAEAPADRRTLAREALVARVENRAEPLLREPEDARGLPQAPGPVLP